MAAPVPQPVLRLCVPFEDLPRELCTCPDRCQVRQCSLCLRDVHYDPKAAIPALGQEFIICSICLEQPAVQTVLLGESQN